MVLIAKNTYRVAGPGHRAMVHKGKTYDDNDPVVKANRWLFATVEEYASQESRPSSTADLGHRSMSARKIETTRQAPGEKRDVDLSCDECDFVGKNPRSLATHQRSHQD